MEQDKKSQTVYVKIKPESELLKAMEEFIVTHSNKYNWIDAEPGSFAYYFSKAGFRLAETKRAKDIGGRVLTATKVIHNDGIGYHYAYPIYQVKGQPCIGYIRPEEIVAVYADVKCTVPVE